MQIKIYIQLSVDWWHISLRLHEAPSPWASYQIRKIAGCACARSAGNIFPPPFHFISFQQFIRTLGPIQTSKAGTKHFRNYTCSNACARTHTHAHTHTRKYTHRLQRKPLFSDPDMHHGTCVTHAPWCMSGSLTRPGGENFTAIPCACATCNFTYLTRGPSRQAVAVHDQ